MTIAGITGSGAAPAWLPLRSPGGGSTFADSLRAQLRAELSSVRAAEGKTAPAADAGVAARASALQRSLLTSNLGVDAANWSKTTRGIGGQYLSADVADVFTRQIALESGNFDPDVIAGRRVSSAGAEGIAQLMPSSYPNVNRLDPIASLHAAGATMRDNLTRYNGDLRKALAAYNAGIGTVDRLQSQLGPNWESGLPDETKVYLRVIMGDGNGR